MKTRIILALLLATGTVMAKSDDQGRRKPPTAAEFIEKLDSDGDGLVSKEEFNGPDEHFVRRDQNEDGYISEEEAPSGPPPRKER